MIGDHLKRTGLACRINYSWMVSQERFWQDPTTLTVQPVSSNQNWAAIRTPLNFSYGATIAVQVLGARVPTEKPRTVTTRSGPKIDQARLNALYNIRAPTFWTALAAGYDCSGSQERILKEHFWLCRVSSLKDTLVMKIGTVYPGMIMNGVITRVAL